MDRISDVIAWVDTGLYYAPVNARWYGGYTPYSIYLPGGYISVRGITEYHLRAGSGEGFLPQAQNDLSITRTLNLEVDTARCVTDRVIYGSHEPFRGYIRREGDGR